MFKVEVEGYAITPCEQNGNVDGFSKGHIQRYRDAQNERMGHPSVQNESRGPLLFSGNQLVSFSRFNSVYIFSAIALVKPISVRSYIDKTRICPTVSYALSSKNFLF